MHDWQVNEMNPRLQRKIEQAKAFLGLETVTTREAIIDQVNALRIESEFNPSHRMWAKRRDIERAGMFLLQHFDAITGYVSQWIYIDPIAFFISEEEAARVRKIEKIKVISVLVVLLAIVGIYLTDAIPASTQANREFLRSSALLYRTTLNVSNYETFESILDRIEDDSDIDRLKEEYALIRDQVHIWANGDLYVDFAAMREAYYFLLAYDQSNDAWLLSKLLNLNGRILPLVLGSRFEANGEFFEIQVTNAANQTIQIMTSFPTAKIPGQSYVVEPSFSWRDFTFRNINDSANYFIAFRIQTITETEIQIYIFANQTTYTLNYDDSE
jgi:hypothetical protein